VGDDVQEGETIIGKARDFLHLEYIPNGVIYSRKGYIDEQPCITLENVTTGSIHGYLKYLRNDANNEIMIFYYSLSIFVVILQHQVREHLFSLHVVHDLYLSIWIFMWLRNICLLQKWMTLMDTDLLFKCFRIS